MLLSKSVAMLASTAISLLTPMLTTLDIDIHMKIAGDENVVLDVNVGIHAEVGVTCGVGEWCCGDWCVRIDMSTHWHLDLSAH